MVIKTGGDRLQEAPLSEIGGKRLFVKEIEDALLDGAIDAAVHSAKDMSAAQPEGLEIAAVLPRDDARDALVLRDGETFADFSSALVRLGGRPSVGTGSVRRVAQLIAVLPHASFGPIRGNVDTRLRKLDSGEFDALVLAAAGLRRLGLAGRISTPIPLDVCVPAPGQGIVAIQIRARDEAVRAAVQSFGNAPAAAALLAERTVVLALGGGCTLPLGAIAVHQPGGVVMHGVVASPDGRRVIRRTVTGSASEPEALGSHLARALAEAGAEAILDQARSHTTG